MKRGDNTLKKLITITVTVLLFMLLLNLAVGIAGAEEIKLRFQHLWWSDGNKLLFEEKLKEFEELYPQVKIEPYYVPFGQYSSVTLARAVAGDAPDILQFHDETIGDWAKFGLLVDLHDYISDELYESFVPSSLKNVEVDGKLLGLSIGHAPDPLLFYRADIFREKGISPPEPGTNWTWEETVQVAMALTEDLNGDGEIDRWGWVTNVNLPLTFMKTFSWLIWSNGGNIIVEDEKGRLVSGFDNPKTIEAWNFYVDLWEKYQVRPLSLIGASGKELDESFRDGTFVMMDRGQWYSGSVGLAKDPDFKYGEQWDVMPLPGPEPGVRILPVHDHFFGITKQCKNKEWAWKLLEFMFSDIEYVKNQSIRDYNLTPPLKVWHEDPLFTDDPFHSKILPYYGDIAYIPTFPRFGAVMDNAVGPITQMVILGDMSREDGLREIHQRINDLLRF